MVGSMPRTADKTRTKTHQVAHSLLTQIRTGQIAIGQYIASETQIMADMNVSRVTVRRAIRSLISQGILESRPGVGYVVLSTQPRTTIGIMVGSGLQAPFHRLMVQAFEDDLRRRGSHVRLYTGRPDGKEHRLDKTEVLQDVKQGRFNGLLTVSWSPNQSKSDQKLTAALARARIPFAPIINENMTAAVGVDSTSIGYLGASHFFKQNIESVGLINVRSEGAGTDTSSHQGYKNACLEYGRSFTQKLVQFIPVNSEKHGYEAMHRWRSRNPHARAVVIGDDIAAKGALVAAIELGLDVPGEFQVAAMSIRGSDTFYVRPFIRLEVDPQTMAQKAVDNLFRMIDDPHDLPERTLLPVRVLKARRTRAVI